MRGARIAIRGLVAGLISALAAGNASSQAYPSRPIHVIMPFSTGGPADSPLRLFGQFLESALGQTIVPEWRPGAGSIVGTAAVAKAVPDGYTLLYTGASLTQMKIFQKELPFDPQTSLVPVSNFIEFETFLVSNSQVPAGSIEEFVAYARANQGKINYGAAGRNSSTFLAMEAFKQASGAPLTEIAYGGSAPYVLAALRNDVQIVPAPLSGGVKGQIDSGALRPLLIFGSRRSPFLPNVPTAADKGWNIPSFGWVGLFAPAGTPRAIVDRLGAEAQRFAAQPDAQKRTLDAGAVLVGSSPDQFRQIIENDTRVWTTIANSLDIKPQ
jgi:tripartite-type tricarboxylate transporter receptor subunit TctC